MCPYQRPVFACPFHPFKRARALHVCVCSRAAARHYRAPARVVSHFELLSSDSYRFDVSVVAEASKQHFAPVHPTRASNSGLPALNAAAAAAADCP